MKNRDIAGYLIGFALFVILVPLLMFWASGWVRPGPAGIACFAVLTVVGLGLSVWSIVYMKIVGKGNPMDALHSWKAAAIFAAYIIIMMVQVSREEKRLEQDFGDAYREYKKSTKKIIPFIW